MSARQAQQQVGQTGTGRQTEISAVIVTYRNKSDISRCLVALEKAVAGLSAEVIVVDNASGDEYGRRGTVGGQVDGTERTDHRARRQRRVRRGLPDRCRCRTWSLAAVSQSRHGHRRGRDRRTACLRAQSSVRGIIGGRFVHADGTSILVRGGVGLVLGQCSVSRSASAHCCAATRSSTRSHRSHGRLILIRYMCARGQRGIYVGEARTVGETRRL